MKKRPGFSVIEIMVVMALVAAMIILARPLFYGLTNASIKKESSEIIRRIRGHFAQAALLGQTYRIVFEIKRDEETDAISSAYWVEASKDDARAAEIIKEEEEGGLWIGERDQEKKEKEKYRRRATFLPLKDMYGKRRDLPTPLRISGIWIEGMDERLREGTFYLYFSPLGYTQRAQISLTDGTSTFVLFVDPLTGEVSVENEEKPVN